MTIVDLSTGKLARLIAVDQIVVRDRHRQDLGDLNELVESMRDLGLLQPVVVNAKHELVAGQRRLAAWQIAFPGRSIWAHVAEGLDDASRHLQAERDENSCRKTLTPSEMVSLGLALEALERPDAIARKAQAPGQAQGVKFSGAKSAPQSRKWEDRAQRQTRTKVADALGIGRTTYDAAKKVVLAAQDETLPPAARAVAQQAVEQMDRTGTVAPAFKLVKGATATDSETRLKAVSESLKPRLPHSVGDVRSLGKKRDATRLLLKVCEQLDGVAHVLEGIDLSKIKPTEVETVIDNLSRFRTVLSRTINQLRSLP